MSKRSSEQPASAPTSLPSSAALECALTSAGRAEGWSTGRVTVTQRRSVAYGSFFSAEVVSCQDELGRSLEIFSKYEDPNRAKDLTAHRAHGHRRGVSYEGLVYSQVLSSMAVETPTFYGSHKSETGKAWLFIENLERAPRLTEIPGDQTSLLQRAGAWLGEFHSQRPSNFDSSKVDAALFAYDSEYMEGWVERFTSYSRDLVDQHPWINGIRPVMRRWAADLVSGTPTVIHGEFYPQNILVSDNHVYPVDWESAGLGPPVIDIAALTEGWPEEGVEACIGSYLTAARRNRDEEFSRRIDLARLYWDLRWLGDRPEWSISRSLSTRLKRIGERAIQLGYLS